MSCCVLKVLLVCLLTTKWVKSQNHDGSDPNADPLDWLRNSIPGEPEVDYPIFEEVQDTSFSCADRIFGGKTKIHII
jgi:hypothetical protein